jgi:hypothetical protein
MTRWVGNLLRKFVAAFDKWQRERLEIWEFSTDPECILRTGVSTTRVGAELSDGTTVYPGDTVGLIHFWNERVPPIPPGGPDVGWAREFMRKLDYSFHLLAQHVVENPKLSGVDAFGGQLPLPFTPASVRLMERLGLEVFDPLEPQGFVDWMIDLGTRTWTWLMRYTFNPESVRGIGLGDLQRRPTWISREGLIRKYAPDRLEEAGFPPEDATLPPGTNEP